MCSEISEQRFGKGQLRGSSQVWCDRQVMMAAKISNLSRRHFLGKFNIYVTEPASLTMITRREKKNKQKKQHETIKLTSLHLFMSDWKLF